MSSEILDFSIIILAHNEEKNLLKLIPRLVYYINKNYYNTEIIFVDSGSTDGSINVIRKFQNNYPGLIRLFRIKKDDFHFAKVRNDYVKKARGKYIIFLSADALPINDKFFDYFIEDFNINKRVVAIFGQHIPYPNTPFIEKIEATIKFEKLNSYIDSRGILVFDLNSPFIPYRKENYYYWYLLSNTFSCYKRDFLIKFPFPEINGYEDMALGKLIIEKNFIKIYDARCKVLHSHILGPYEYFKKQCEEFAAINNELLDVQKPINIKFKINKINALNKSIFYKLFYLCELLGLYLIKAMAFFRVRIFGYKL